MSCFPFFGIIEGKKNTTQKKKTLFPKNSNSKNQKTWWFKIFARNLLFLWRFLRSTPPILHSLPWLHKNTSFRNAFWRNTLPNSIKFRFSRTWWKKIDIHLAHVTKFVETPHEHHGQAPHLVWWPAPGISCWAFLLSLFPKPCVTEEMRFKNCPVFIKNSAVGPTYHESFTPLFPSVRNRGATQVTFPLRRSISYWKISFLALPLFFSNLSKYCPCHKKR